MLAVSAVLVLAVSLLLVEGSLVFYRLPIAPEWLRRRKGLQAMLSSLLSYGLIIGILMMGQYLIELGDEPFKLLDIILVCAVVVAFVVAWRRLRAFERRAATAEEAVETEPTVETPRRAA